MMITMKKILLIILLIFTTVTFAESQDLYPFNDGAKQQQFQQLLTQLRCLVCQNQNLADSNASLAVDLRKLVYELVNQQHSDTFIIKYLTARYGDFILFQPPLKPMTYVLWYGPFLLFGLAISALVIVIYRRAQK